jgi:probable phosphoglycerate mutase
LTQFAIVRHGVTDWNLEGRMQGHQDIPLNVIGKEQIAQVAARLQLEHWDMIVYSDLIRATQTALCIADSAGIHNRIVDKRLRERSFGILEGTTIEERIQRWGVDWKRLKLGVEEDSSLLTRATECMDYFSREYQDQKIIVVTHGGWIRQFFNYAFPNEFLDHPNNSSLSLIQRKSDGWLCSLYNSTTHLNKEPIAREEL